MTRREDPVWGSDEKASTGNVDSMHVTNSVPQIQPFNAGIWLQLESYALDHTREDDMRICVFTGPFFDRDDPMRYGVPIPLKFWKVLAFLHSDTGKLTATGYTMSQEPFLGESEFVFGQHQNRQRPVHAIERQAGLSFGPLAEVDPMRDVPESVDRLLTAPSQIKFR
jgi:endonuclease G